MTSVEVAIEVGKIAATFVAAWLAIDVKLKWLRSDVDKHEVRITQLEKIKWRGR